MFSYKWLCFSESIDLDHEKEEYLKKLKEKLHRGRSSKTKCSSPSKYSYMKFFVEVDWVGHNSVHKTRTTSWICSTTKENDTLYVHNIIQNLLIKTFCYKWCLDLMKPCWAAWYFFNLQHHEWPISICNVVKLCVLSL